MDQIPLFLSYMSTKKTEVMLERIRMKELLLFKAVMVIFPVFVPVCFAGLGQKTYKNLFFFKKFLFFVAIGYPQLPIRLFKTPKKN
mgnify:CR=1 FL=1